MNRSLLPKLRKIKAKDAKSALNYCRAALEVFGYASISRQQVHDFDIDMEKASEENDWHVRRYVLVFGIVPAKKGAGSFNGITPTYKTDARRKKTVHN